MTLSDIKQIIMGMGNHLTGDYSFTPENVYQVGSPKNKATIGGILDTFLLPGSRIENIKAFLELDERSRAGESCLILAEHYSNFDFPILYRLVDQAHELGTETAERLLPIRGMKLSETNILTAIFTRSYDSILIYPSRTLDAISDQEELRELRNVSVPINRAAIREMISRSHNGRIITIFPAGTRYRPWKPDTRKGVREIYSYLKIFENIMFVSINGNTLPPNESDDMTKDLPEPDLMILTCSDILNGKQFKKKAEESTPEGKDVKSHVGDSVMARLFDMHNEIEPLRLAEKALCQNPGGAAPRRAHPSAPP